MSILKYSNSTQPVAQNYTTSKPAYGSLAWVQQERHQGRYYMTSARADVAPVLIHDANNPASPKPSSAQSLRTGLRAKIKHLLPRSRPKDTESPTLVNRINERLKGLFARKPRDVKKTQETEQTWESILDDTRNQLKKTSTPQGTKDNWGHIGKGATI